MTATTATAVDPQKVAYGQSCRDAEWSQRCLLALLSFTGIPKRFLDVGCGRGNLVHTLVSLGVSAYGVDINADGDDLHVFRGDLTCADALDAPSIRDEPFDLVLCLETAEHLPASAADLLCMHLAEATADNGLLVFSAATPGQGGSGHLNEQPRKYWRDKLVARGFTPERFLTRQIAIVWRQVCGPCYWYPDNVQVMRKGGV